MMFYRLREEREADRAPPLSKSTKPNVLAELEEGGFAEVGRKLRGHELEIVERAEDK